MIETGQAAIRVRHGGGGRPVLLLHGFPQTHLMWHKIAPRLAREFTVVAADLRGYGAAANQARLPTTSPTPKGAMARDMVAVMERLGFDRFSVVGHDRGGPVAYRLALDHPTRVERLAVLDIVPVSEAFRRADMAFVLSFRPWSLLSRPSRLPERLFGAVPEAVLEAALVRLKRGRRAFPDEVRAEYRRALGDPETIHAICESIGLPPRSTWSTTEPTTVRGDASAAGPGAPEWTQRAPEVARHVGDLARLGRQGPGAPLDCVHFLHEEAPDETYSVLRAFLMGRDEAGT